MGHGHGHDEHFEHVERYNFEAGTRKFTFGLIGVGLVLLILGIFLAKGKYDHHEDGHHASATTTALVSNDAHGDDHGDDHAKADKAHGAEAHGDDHGGGHHGPKGGLLGRIFSNLLLNGFYFTGLSLLALFIVSVSYAANGGWYAMFKRIPESMSVFAPIGAAMLLLVFVLGKEYLYFWSIPEIAAHDELIQKKAGYLNTGFFIGREAVILLIWAALIYFIRKTSSEEDRFGDPNSYNKYFLRQNLLSGIYLITFAATFSFFSWDYIMSIDAHWFSTMFAVRTFSTMFVSAFALMTLIVLHLKAEGFLPYFNKSHQHDLGKFVFAFSIFWTYIWFGEYILIWYANIPEEGVYYDTRLSYYKLPFFTNVFINFVLPFFVLMTNDSKRQATTLAVMCVIILLGHWLDLFVMIMPGTMGAEWGIGLLEIGMYLFFMGAYLFATLSTLSKVKLIPVNHPYLKESLLHHYH